MEVFLLNIFSGLFFFFFFALKETPTCKERPLEIQNGCFLQSKALCQRTRSNSTSKLQRNHPFSCSILKELSTELCWQCWKIAQLLSRHSEILS